MSHEHQAHANAKLFLKHCKTARALRPFFRFESFEDDQDGFGGSRGRFFCFCEEHVYDVRLFTHADLKRLLEKMDCDWPAWSSFYQMRKHVVEQLQKYERLDRLYHPLWRFNASVNTTVQNDADVYWHINDTRTSPMGHHINDTGTSPMGHKKMTKHYNVTSLKEMLQSAWERIKAYEEALDEYNRKRDQRVLAEVGAAVERGYYTMHHGGKVEGLDSIFSRVALDFPQQRSALGGKRDTLRECLNRVTYLGTETVELTDQEANIYLQFVDFEAPEVPDFDEVHPEE